MSGLEELYGDDAETNAPVAETPAAETVAAPEPQADLGAVLETPAAETPPAATPESNDHSVPLPVFLRQRDDLGGKLTAAEQRALVAEQKLAAFMRKQEEVSANVEIPHPLDDPEGFKASLLKVQQKAVQDAVGPLREQHQQQLEQLSKTMLVRHIGAEKFGELEQFINAAPDQAHAVAMRQADPYGWFYEKFEQALKARKDSETLKSLQGKSIEEIVAERVAAELAKQTQAAAPAIEVPVTDARPRNSDGTFAPQPTQRHTPQSLAEVNGAAVVASNGASGSALEELYN